MRKSSPANSISRRTHIQSHRSASLLGSACRRQNMAETSDRTKPRPRAAKIAYLAAVGRGASLQNG
eukprot:scaffold116912_cov66-Phaeocystis_antarctica.AAC.2